MPDVLFTGSCGTQLGALDFIVQEYILTQTVEAWSDKLQTVEVLWPSLANISVT